MDSDSDERYFQARVAKILALAQLEVREPRVFPFEVAFPIDTDFFLHIRFFTNVGFPAD